MRKKTVGSIASELQTKNTHSFDARELQRATEQEYLDNLIWAVQHAQKKVSCDHLPDHQSCKDRTAFSDSFFIAALLKKEKLLSNVIRNYFVPTKDCPTPTYDQTIYRYDHHKESIEFLWVIPDQETCEIFHFNKNIIVPSEQGLLANVLAFYDGTLLKKCKELNGETQFAGSSLKGKELWH